MRRSVGATFLTLAELKTSIFDAETNFYSLCAIQRIALNLPLQIDFHFQTHLEFVVLAFIHAGRVDGRS